MTPDHNLVVIEVKKFEDEGDSVKARDYTSVPSGFRRFQYQYGVALSFLPKPRLAWFANGEQIG
jgi:hypothetical protein